MKIASFNRVKDFGTDFELDLLIFKRFKVFSINLSWCEFSGPYYLQASSGINSALTLLLCIGKFGIEICLGRRNYADVCDKYWLDK